mgnify:CR=1 FL=1
MKEWSEDSYIDATSMEKELLKISHLHGKYLNVLSYHRHIVRKLEAEYKSMRSLREDYFLGRLTKEEMDERGWEYIQEINSNPKVARLLDNDPEITKILMKRIAHEEIVSYCENVLKSLHNRTWDLGNYVKYQQLTLGK